ncbi:hypothetical protein CHY_0333 [Carboxydothermus hydrogenoformans Z-2901]|uniref:Uncharacterized protein n=1 Tax=Carboxydothermus hydrogenoformans (strain ATCC BAA-161 / DSM 6008 / Z-2901) TaxID=246194 RepID=Q3AF88_CARHZ|nr:hypothetical protein CHY_0333 [Carboxydothermus hydrogenoformans Z-2901]
MPGALYPGSKVVPRKVPLSPLGERGFFYNG